MDKLKRLKSRLKKMDSVLVAYSGGVDSTLLLKACRDVLRDKVLAVTADSPTYTAEELSFARKMAGAIGVRHKVIKTFELDDEKFSVNPRNRCYFCKSELFSKLKEIARRGSLNFVIDGSNASDKQDFRPGSEAKKELGVRSPLQEAGLTKKDIRYYSRRLGLITWDKPAQACLASRIPYGTEISLPILSRISQGETALHKLGFTLARLRHYNGLCRIEVPKEDIARLVNKRLKVINALKKVGYNYITIDLEGYRSGSLNEVLKK